MTINLQMTSEDQRPPVPQPNPSVDTPDLSSPSSSPHSTSPMSEIPPRSIASVAMAEVSHNDLKIHVEPPKVKEHKLVEYYIALGGLILIGICALWGLNTNHENFPFNLVLITGALAILIGASNIVLENSVRLAESFHVPEIVIGLTLVSVGTSIPEIFTAILSAWRGIGGLSIGDIYGSWITQLSLFLGVVILIRPNTVEHSFIPHVKRDAGLMILALLFLSRNIWNGSILRWEAGVSIILFLSYNIYLYVDARRNPVTHVETLYDKTQLAQELGVHTSQETAQVFQTALVEEGITSARSNGKKVISSQKKHLILKSMQYLFLLGVGVILCFIGALYTVQAGADTARIFGVSEHIIGTTIVGFGTGLPELIVSAAAMSKDKPDIAYGNLIGSNIVDPLFSISLGVLVRPVYLAQTAVWNILAISLPVAVVIGLFIIYIFSRHETNQRMGAFFGVILILFYFIYIALTILFHLG